MLKFILFFLTMFFFTGCNTEYNQFYQMNSTEQLNKSRNVSKSNNQLRQSGQNNFPYPTKSHNEVSLQAVTRTRFSKKKVLNSQEGKLYWILVRAVQSIQNKPYSLLSQVSLGEILKHDGEEYRHINCKRADFCIVDRQFEPFMLIEYNGEGHYSNDSSTRDEIKRVACDSAGIHYITITHNEELQEAVNRKVLPLLSSIN